jgi:hypothetical protein
MAKQRSIKQIKIFEKIFGKKKQEAEIRKEPKKKLPPVDYDGMGDFTRFGRPK